MGCGNSVEDQVLLAKLDRLEVQVKKEKQLNEYDRKKRWYLSYCKECRKIKRKCK